MKSFRTLLITAIRQVLLVWAACLTTLTYLSDKTAEARMGWYFAAACLVLMHIALRIQSKRYQAKLIAS